jgi:hypothetical protein
MSNICIIGVNLSICVIYHEGTQCKKQKTFGKGRDLQYNQADFKVTEGNAIFYAFVRSLR